MDTNHRQFSSAKGITIADAASSLPISSFITSDPPAHGPKRRAVQPVVVPQNLKNLESLIRSRSIEILESLPVGEEFNWVELVSINLTTQMLATLFGFPFEDRHKLTLWSDNLTTGVSPKDVEGTARNRAVMLECLQYFQALWHERKQTEGGFDLLSLMQRDPATANVIDDPMHFLGNIALLIVGGNDTTRNSISGGVLALNQNPAQYHKLRADHSLIDSMVPEIIRWQTPLIHMRRTAIEDVELQGRTIRKGDKVVMWYISGNRDDTVIENADDFIIDRPNSRHHLCLWLRHSPLHGQPAGGNATAGALGGDHATLRNDRGRRPGTARAFQLHPRLHGIAGRCASLIGLRGNFDGHNEFHMVMLARRDVAGPEPMAPLRNPPENQDQLSQVVVGLSQRLWFQPARPHADIGCEAPLHRRRCLNGSAANDSRSQTWHSVPAGVPAGRSP